MAKSVKISKPVPAPAGPSKEELLARVTGNPGLKPPPGRTLPAGVTGTPPLPLNQVRTAVVTDINPESLSEMERQELMSRGWDGESKIPNNVSELLTKVEKIKEENLVAQVNLPVDPRTPPLNVTTTPIGKLSLADQQRIKAAQAEFARLAEEGVAAEKAAAVANAAAAKQAMAEFAGGPKIPGLSKAVQAAAQAVAQPETSPDAILDDRKTPPPPPVGTPSETGANLQHTHCPHCLWDLAQPGVPEPPYPDKMAFLQAILGNKPWVKEYSLFGGNLKVVFRTLQIREVEVVYKQTYLDREAGRLPAEADFWNQLNRYRFYLQLQKIESVGTVLHELPDALSAETNPHGTAFWEVEMEANEQTPLRQIETHIIDKVIQSEMVFHTLNLACNDFNRLAAKLEAMADNSDFWKPTEVPS